MQLKCWSPESICVASSLIGSYPYVKNILFHVLWFYKAEKKHLMHVLSQRFDLYCIICSEMKLALETVYQSKETPQ